MEREHAVLHRMKKEIHERVTERVTDQKWQTKLQPIPTRRLTTGLTCMEKVSLTATTD